MARTCVTARSHEQSRTHNTRGSQRSSPKAGWLLLTTVALFPYLFTSTLSGVAHAQSKKVDIFVNDVVNGVGSPALKKTEVSYVRLGGRCEFRLEFNPSSARTQRAIKEVAGDRGDPQRHTTNGCLPPAFNFTQATGPRQYEEQTTYYWTKVARDYAVRMLWITPAGVSERPRLASDAVQPDVLTDSSFNTACFDKGPESSGCMRAWPHEGPKIHIKAGQADERTVVHEFGHYACGYVFGHMDPIDFSVPAAFGDSAKLAFQEAAADMFRDLVLHDLAVAGDTRARDTSGTSKWPPSTQNWYDMEAPLENAFRQALWGADASNTITVNWRPDPNNPTMANNPSVANTTMARAFAYALVMNKGHRIDLMATTLLTWISAHEPRRATEIQKIFEAHGFASALGTSCVDHGQCASLRCDNRPGAGCVALDGQAETGQFCTTHQQCRSQSCQIASGKISGICTSTRKQLGEACTTHQECASQRCDNRPGAGCVAQDGQAETGEFCTTHQQCRSQSCQIASGKISGICTSTTKRLGEACTTHQECASQRCDNRPGAGCVAQDGQAESGEFCTTHQQCRSQSCNVRSGTISGNCR